MSKVVLSIYDDKFREDVVFEGQTVSEVLAMKVEYLMQTVGPTSDEGKGEAPGEGDFGGSPGPASFLNKLKGGE